MVTLSDIRAARAAIAPRVHRTPLLSFHALGEHLGASCYLKAEQLQKTGSFKVRGALNKVHRLTAEERARGLIAVSAGNHAQGVAYAAASQGIACTVVMPENAPRTKVLASQGYGATVVQHGTLGDAFAHVEVLRAEQGSTFVHPSDDLDIIAGQGTIALEIHEELPDVDLIVVGVGGGGLFAGLLAAMRELRPEARVVGVEPEGAAGLTAALRAGRVVRLPEVHTIADGLAAPMTGEHVLEHVRALEGEVVQVSDEEIVEGIRYLLERAKLLAEPAGAAGVAALLAGKIQVPSGARVAVIATGGNVDLERLREFLPG